MRSTLVLLSVACLPMLTGCGNDRDGVALVDAGLVDADVSDAGVVDAGGGDAGAGVDLDAGFDAATASDAGARPGTDAGDDAGASDPIGMISGSCGVLGTELTDLSPHWFQSATFFPDGWTIADSAAVSTGAQTILLEGTAGGTSGYSEAFAFEVLHRCEGASLVKTETHIVYSVPMPGSMTDILVEIMGQRIGVSVTRAVTVTGMCTRADTYTTTQATDLLTRKLAGINESSMLVAPEDAWTKQILFIYADTDVAAAALMTVWSTLDATLRADTILYVSVSELMDSFIYFEARCP